MKKYLLKYSAYQNNNQLVKLEQEFKSIGRCLKKIEELKSNMLVVKYVVYSIEMTKIIEENLSILD